MFLNIKIYLVGYIVYFALLLTMSNDVETNPGRTLNEIVAQHAKTISANFSQGDRRQFGHNAGKQCVAMTVTAIHAGCIKKVDPFKFKLSIAYCIIFNALIASN